MATAVFDDRYLKQICKVLGDTNTGLTGTDIGRYLNDIGLDDVSPGNTKWVRLYDALKATQIASESGIDVVKFIEHAMNPVNYWSSPKSFARRQEEINRVLGFCGYRVEDDGHIVAINPIQTLTEAQQRARNLYSLLETRNTHSDILKVCKPELMADNYYHAVLEAAKGIASKIRNLSGFTEDGSRLASKAFGGETPSLAINALNSESQWSEQSGFLNLLQGVFLAFRNPIAHELKNEWPLNEQDAIDIMSLISYLHRRLDNAVENSEHKSRPSKT